MSNLREPLLRWVLGDILRRARRQQGRTLKDVALEAQVSMPYLSEVERGLKEASSEVLAAICQALDLTVADLLALAHGELSAVQEPATLLSHTELAPSPHGIGNYDIGAVSLYAAA
jgi:transcriptional regulator with XRE-family HTH domain